MEQEKLLIVEDEILVATDIHAMVENQGYSVIAVVDNGKEAVRVATEQKPDLVLMDINLKGDMDGIEAAGRIRSQSEIPIVFLTAHAEEGLLERAKLVFPFGYLLKPVQERELKATLKIALHAVKMSVIRTKGGKKLIETNEQLEKKVEEKTADLNREIGERKSEIITPQCE
jgi:CheY-like chemotaxis protein